MSQPDAGLFLVPKSWGEFQHYKQRIPPWIKLHRHLLDDFDFHCLHVASKALAPLLWLIASEYDNGRIPFDAKLLSFRLRMTEQDFLFAVTPLIDSGFFSVDGDASATLASCKQEPITETETETETETKTTLSSISSTSPISIPPQKKKAKSYQNEARHLLQFLNEKTDRAFQPVDANLDLIAARLKEGATVESCKQVIARKTRAWRNDPKMADYLRPATLFNRTKFAQYAGELVEHKDAQNG